MYKLLSAGLVLLFAAAPASTNYTLKSYDIGSGGTGASSSSTYKLQAATGEQSAKLQSSASYQATSGVNGTENSNVPPAPAFTNSSNYYDKLKLVLNTGSNPTDTKYLIAISNDNFTTTNYVQTDDTPGSSQAISNYQTYAAWGGASGFTVLGLNPSTTYSVKVKALQGNFSGSAFGPTTSAATVAPSLSFGLSTTATSTPPFPVSFSALIPNNVVNGSADAVISLSSNADNGGGVYVVSQNGGLVSNSAAATITSATADLSSATNGYGAQVITTSAVTSVSPFDQSSSNVGGLSTSLRQILGATGPVSSGSGTIRLMAKSDSTTPAAGDYSDTLTFVSAMTF